MHCRRSFRTPSSRSTTILSSIRMARLRPVHRQCTAAPTRRRPSRNRARRWQVQSRQCRITSRPTTTTRHLELNLHKQCRHRHRHDRPTSTDRPTCQLPHRHHHRPDRLDRCHMDSFRRRRLRDPQGKSLLQRSRMPCRRCRRHGRASNHSRVHHSRVHRSSRAHHSRWGLLPLTAGPPSRRQQRRRRRQRDRVSRRPSLLRPCRQPLPSPHNRSKRSCQARQPGSCRRRSG